ncbi:hypothetical protein BJ508DRAFT_314245 [Ascobolus immersus RN42]|uniref:Uncharacterized protein n=1 Tax=Ascobolus immersus RN42 TaxID=1160509 RepID=A0A3N4HFT3_ASCIM|nr:hypothetical protein BJ508DRAFT_314245 [Ascobolus immersus RN42]
MALTLQAAAEIRIQETFPKSFADLAVNIVSSVPLLPHGKYNYQPSKRHDSDDTYVCADTTKAYGSCGGLQLLHPVGKASNGNYLVPIDGSKVNRSGMGSRGRTYRRVGVNDRFDVMALVESRLASLENRRTTKAGGSNTWAVDSVPSQYPEEGREHTKKDRQTVMQDAYSTPMHVISTKNHFPHCLALPAVRTSLSGIAG